MGEPKSGSARILEGPKETGWEMDFEEHPTCTSELLKVKGTENAMDRKSISIYH